MRVLWLAIDHSKRVMDLFGPFRRAVMRRPDVEVDCRMRTLGKKAGDVCRRIWDPGRPGVEPFPRILKHPEEANEFDLVMVDTAWLFQSEDWAKVKTPVACTWGDNHGSMVPRYLDAAHDLWQIFLPMLEESFEKFHADRFTDRFWQWLPWSVEPEMFHDYKQPKTIDVLSTGVISKNVYPIRTRALRACTGEGSGLKELPRFLRVERPREDESGSQYPRRDDYARLLNQSILSLSCSGRWHYALGKTFEIPAARSILVSDCCRDVRNLGFNPGSNMLEITPGMNYRSMRRAIESWLNDPDYMDRIASNGYALVHENHTNDIRAGQFVRLMEELI